jgi:hypothetical protein
MKDTIRNLAAGIVVAIFSAFLGWAIAQSSKPEVQVQIDRPLILSSERITVFRIRNVGGAPASNIELRFAASLPLASIVSITPMPAPSQQSSRPFLNIPKLRPYDEVSFYVRETSPFNENARGLVEKAVYDEGQVGISTNDERLNSYVLEQKINAGFFGFIVGIVLFSIIIVVAKLREKRPIQSTTDNSGASPLRV